MTRKKRPAGPHGPELFAVECPACLMAVAAAGDLIGSVARCPLCRADFRVPEPNQPDAGPQERKQPQPSQPQADGVKPDRVEASEPKESAPPTVASTPEPLATAAPSAPPAPETTAAVAPDSAIAPPATAGPTPASFGVSPAPAPQPGPLTIPPSPAAENFIPAPPQADLFEITTEPPPAPDPELAFREPVRTIVSGDEVIELRRLTPEEKRLRQARRNMVMLLAGALVLILITVLLGRGTGR
jgi:hypothetical protein